MKTVLTEKDYNLFYKSIIYGDFSNPLYSSIKSAYRDVCRTISGFSKNENHNQIYRNAINILENNINELLTININSQTEFDKWHKECCDQLIKTFQNQKFYYGQAQKWVNMSLKNLSMFEHKRVEKMYQFFHVPIDNYILNSTNYKFSTAWSRIDNYSDYIDFQNYFRDKYEGIPLDVEFKMWLKESRNIKDYR